jgi:hypothetical protein
MRGKTSRFFSLLRNALFPSLTPPPSSPEKPHVFHCSGGVCFEKRFMSYDWTI